MTHLCGRIFHFEKAGASTIVFADLMQSFLKKKFFESTLPKVLTFRKVAVAAANCLLFYCLLFVGCAQIVSPTGGPEDKTPPQLDTLLSTRNYQTRFEKKTIVLAFDEWVELRDAFSQVIVSPPLEFRPEVVRKKKTIQLSFNENEVLRDSATYVINFGQAIRDITEGNVAPVTFVFSTGDFIDSLSVSGQIVDAFTNEPVEDVLFLLYENLADSVFKKERPFYFARTDKDGNFTVKNMKGGTFKATALVDGNLNYLYDSEAEKIGFLDEPILVKGVEKTAIDSVTPDSLNIVLDSLQIDTLKIDSVPPEPRTKNQEPRTKNQEPKTKNQKPISLRLFQPESRLFIMDDDSEKYGLVKLTFNRKPFGAAQISFDSIGQSVLFETEKDTTRLWYSVPTEQEWNVYVKIDTLIDTLAVKTGNRADFYENETFRVKGKAPKNLPVQPPERPFFVEFNHPISVFDSTQIRLYEDSMRVAVRPNLGVDSSNVRRLFLDFPWKPNVKYECEFWPGGITDIYGLSLPDTVRRSLMAGAPADYSTLTLRVKNLRPDTAYVIRLLEQNGNEYRSFRVADTSLFETRLTFVPPGTYSVELIEDLDRNGRWTTGNYDLRRQPERVRRRTLEELRADWEVDSEMEWRDAAPSPAEGSTGDGPAPETGSKSILPRGSNRGGGGDNR
jgi:hypothetical protein